MTTETSSSSARQKREHKLEQLCAQLLGTSSQPKGSAADYLSSSAIAGALFRSAPAEFLEAKTIEDLKTIASRCQEIVSLASNQGGKINIRSFSLPDRSALVVSLGDRPFIINTLRE